MAKRPRRPSADFENVDGFQVKTDISVRGATEKDVLEDPSTGHVYIAKLGGRNNDLEVMTEYIINIIGRSLGIRVAEARIARYRGRLRFLSRYFLDASKREELVHGVQLFSELYDETAVAKVLGNLRQEQEMFSVQAVRAALGAHYLDDGERLFADFVAMMAHDALIGVQDRHHENWGVIVQREVAGQRPRLAPLYDSARGLFCNVTNDTLSQYLGARGETALNRYVSRAHPLVGFDGLQPVQNRKCVTHDQLVSAIFREYPDQRAGIVSILDAYDWELVRDELRVRLGGLCNSQRMTLILTCLRRRLRLLRRAIHGNVQ